MTSRGPVLLLAATAAFAVGGWSVGTSDALAEVEVTGAAPRCTGTTVGEGAVVAAVAGMRCTYTVTVANQGGDDVHLGLTSAAFLGPEGGSVIRAESVAGLSPDPRGRGDDLGGLDAVVDLDRDLGPGAAYSFDVVVVFRPEGCNDGGTVTIGDQPDVEVSAWGRTATRSSSQDVVIHRDGRTPGCGPA